MLVHVGPTRYVLTASYVRPTAQQGFVWGVESTVQGPQTRDWLVGVALDGFLGWGSRREEPHPEDGMPLSAPGPMQWLVGLDVGAASIPQEDYAANDPGFPPSTGPTTTTASMAARTSRRLGQQGSSGGSPSTCVPATN